jgi:hypothetical protein
MPTFLRSPIARALSRIRRQRLRVISLILLTLCSNSGMPAASSRTHSVPKPSAALTAPGTDRKRLIMLRRNDEPEGARFTLMSDSTLDDYKSFAEGERLCVLIPQAAFVSARGELKGSGFADMRIEQRENDVMLCFRLQQGATVAVNQNFNRLEVVFMTNELANSNGPR